MNTEFDLPGLETHDEKRHCETCGQTTTQRVGTVKEVYDGKLGSITWEHEYAHCTLCATTTTITLSKTIARKDTK